MFPSLKAQLLLRMASVFWCLWRLCYGFLALEASDLDNEVRIREAVAVHDLDQVIQDAVEHLVELLSPNGQKLLRRQGCSVELNLKDEGGRE